MTESSKTDRVIHEIESDPGTFSLAMEAVLSLMDQEHRVADMLEEAVNIGERDLPRGWVDWSQVLQHLRHRAETGIIRDELRRNRDAGRKFTVAEADALPAQ